MHTSADKLVQVEVLILNETLAEKKAQASATLANKLLEVKSKTTGETVT